jgi:hypothetical protein
VVDPTTESKEESRARARGGPALILGLALTCAGILAGGCGMERPPSEPAHALRAVVTDDDLNEWITYYYLYPTPELVPASWRLLVATPMADPEPMAAFFGRVFHQNPARIPSWVHELIGAAALPAQREFLWLSLWFSDTAEGRAALAASSERAAQGLLQRTAPDPWTMTITSAGDLDILWASFFATGDEQLLHRFVEVLPWSESRGNPQRLAIGASARWSLASNAAQHSQVMKFCERARRGEQEPLQALLKDVLRQARQERAAMRAVAATS